MMELVFITESILIREIKKRDGTVAYGFCRPYGDGKPFMEYANKAEAEFIAQYVNRHGDGSFEKEIRKAAKDAWKKQQIVMI